MSSSQKREADFDPGQYKLKTLFACLVTALLAAICFQLWSSIAGRPVLSPTGAWFLVYAILILLVSLPRVYGLLDGLLDRLSRFMTSRDLFVSDPVTEAPKLALLRIVLGAFLVQRAFYILLYAFPEDFTHPILVFTMLANLVAGLCVLFGFFTQPAFVYLVFYQFTLGDAIQATSTLGNDIGGMLVFLLLLSNAGAHLSVDRALMRGNTWLGRLLAMTYAAGGLPDPRTLQLSKLMAITSYWLVCMYSLSTHVNEEAWMTGVAGPFILTNNFMMNHHEFFAALFTKSTLATHLARYSIWVMMLWYASILPFLFIGGLLRKYVIVWGLLFFSLSTFLLKLGWLGYFEFLLWAALFWSTRFVRHASPLKVAFDDRCNLCDGTVRFLKFVDIFRAIELLPASANKDYLSTRGLSYQEAMKDLFGFDDANNRAYKGYAFYTELSRRILLLLPLYPVLLAGRLFNIGPRLYSVIADYRIRLSGVCEIPSQKTEYDYASMQGAQTPFAGMKTLFIAVFVHYLISASFYFTTIPYSVLQPVRSVLAKSSKATYRRLHRSAQIYGMTPIDVFNSSDLKMAEHWFTLDAIREGGRRERLPLFADNGTRLAWHQSDRIYFGHTAKYRRLVRNDGPMCYRPHDNLMLRRLTTLHEARSESPIAYYLATYYYQPLFNPESVRKGKMKILRARKVCTLRYFVEPASVRIRKIRQPERWRMDPGD